MLGLGAYYRGMVTGAMSVVAPIAGVSAIIPVCFGVATGDSPSVAQVAGVACALAGVGLASIDAKSGTRFSKEAIAPLKTLRGWAFTWTFLSIGFTTRFRELTRFGWKPFAAFADRRTGCVDAGRQRRFRDDATVPDGGNEVVAADHMVAMHDEVGEKVKHLRFERDQFGAAAELAPVGIGLSCPSLPWAARTRRSPPCPARCGSRPQDRRAR